MLTRPTSPARRRRVRGLLATLVALALAVLTIAPAQAAAYRYWGFNQLTDGAWAYAQKGPDQTTPEDGTVEGWRYAIGDESSSRLPRAVLTFDELCASTPAQDGKKRVGLVIDYGRSADSAGSATPPARPRAARSWRPMGRARTCSPPPVSSASRAASSAPSPATRPPTAVVR